MFQCHICDHTSYSARSFYHHTVTHKHHINATFRCCETNCFKIFKTYIAFDTHISRYHKILRKKITYDSTKIKLSCNKVLCHKSFTNVHDLINHLKHHLKNGEVIQCCFSNCKKVFKLKSSFSSHISRYHLKLTKHFISTQCMRKETITIKETVHDHNEITLHNSNISQIENVDTITTKSENVETNIDTVITPSENAETNIDTVTASSENVETNIDTVTASPENVETNIAQNMAKNAALFCLMLETKCLIPSITVQKIVQEFNTLILTDITNFKYNFIMKLNSLNLEEENKSLILNYIEQYNFLTSFFNLETGLLRTTFLRIKYFEDNLNFVQPIEIELGKNQYNNMSKFHYVPIKETLKYLLRDQSFQAQLQKPQMRNDYILSDIMDGYLFKSNITFENSETLQLILFQDSFELVNPLGSSKNKHKILAFYFSLGNIYPEYRSQINQIQLLQLCLEKDVKVFGEKKIFQRMLNDLKELEEGINIDGQYVKAVIYCICGDNLGSHFIGGFPQNFSSSESMCRYCTIKRSHWVNQLYPTLDGEEYTKENYEAQIEQLNISQSVFNELKYFHVSCGLPPCLAHDLFEGVVSSDLLLFLNYFIKVKKQITNDNLNYAINTFKFIGSDSSNKPPVISKSCKKLNGTAIQNWTFLRFLPLMISNKIDTNDSVWHLILQLREIVEYVTAPQLSHGQVMCMGTLINEYLYDRKKMFPNNNLKPKHHFIQHYTELFFKFGPLIRLWTLRFESKHSFFKKVVRSTQNFKNITHTLSTKHQLLQAYNLNGNIFQNPVHINDKTKFDIDLYNSSIQEAVKKVTSNDLFLSHKIEIYHTLYKPGQFLNVHDDRFYEILFFLSNNVYDIFFVIKSYINWWCSKRGVQIIEESPHEKIECIKYSDLKNFSPLNCYNISNEKIIVLKHKAVVLLNYSE